MSVKSRSFLSRGSSQFHTELPEHGWWSSWTRNSCFYWLVCDSGEDDVFFSSSGAAKEEDGKREKYLHSQGSVLGTNKKRWNLSSKACLEQEDASGQHLLIFLLLLPALSCSLKTFFIPWFVSHSLPAFIAFQVLLWHTRHLLLVLASLLVLLLAKK